MSPHAINVIVRCCRTPGFLVRIIRAFKVLGSMVDEREHTTCAITCSTFSFYAACIQTWRHKIETKSIILQNCSLDVSWSLGIAIKFDCTACLQNPILLVRGTRYSTNSHINGFNNHFFILLPCLRGNSVFEINLCGILRHVWSCSSISEELVTIQSSDNLWPYFIITNVWNTSEDPRYSW